MFERYKINKTICRLFELRKAIQECEKDLGVSGYSEVERAVFSYITSNPKATITLIKTNSYFSKYSLSTIKRAVLFLNSNDLVESKQSLVDKREMILKLKGC